jgi:hypothetical protein
LLEQRPRFSSVEVETHKVDEKVEPLKHRGAHRCAERVYRLRLGLGCNAIKIKSQARLSEGDVCTNGAVAREHLGTYARRHVGSKVISNLDVSQLLSDEAREADDRAFWLATRDLIRSIFDYPK